MMPNLTTPSFSTVCDSTQSDVYCPMSTRCLDSGHALQVKDMSGQEPNGLAECTLLCHLDGMPGTNLIFTRHLRY